MNRNLRFRNLDEAVMELEMLGKGKVETKELWSYYQILTHCADLIENSMTSYPRVLPFIIRKTIGKFIFVKMLRDGYMKPGNPNPSAPKKHEEGDEKAAHFRLKSVIEKFKRYDGPFANHPIFDVRNKEEWEKLHAMHIANHLGFAYLSFDGIEKARAKKSVPGKTLRSKKKMTPVKKPKKKNKSSR